MQKQFDYWLPVAMLAGSTTLSVTLLILGIWKLFDLITSIAW